MRRRLVAATLVLLAPAVFAPRAGASACGTPSGPGALPDPKAFIQAKPQCPYKVDVSPSVTTPECASGVYQCVLGYHTCTGPRTVYSDHKGGGTGMCDEYWAVHHALAQRTICCDRGSRKRK